MRRKRHTGCDYKQNSPLVDVPAFSCGRLSKPQALAAANALLVGVAQLQLER